MAQQVRGRHVAVSFTATVAYVAEEILQGVQVYS